MSTSRGTKSPGASRKPAPPPKPAAAADEVQPISPLGLVGAVFVALVIAGILLFVINARTNGSRSLTPAPGATTAPGASGGSVRGDSGFVKGPDQAKVTLVEYGDFQ